jgi:hypothetical protein
VSFASPETIMDKVICGKIWNKGDALEEIKATK